MDRNTRSTKVVLVIFFSTVLFINCNKNIQHGIKKNDNTGDSLLVNELIEQMKSDEITECDIKWKMPNKARIANLIHTNYNDLFCIRNKARKGNQDAINMLSKIVAYWGKDQPIQYLKPTIFSKVYDPLLFIEYINVLKNETEIKFTENYIIDPIHTVIAKELVEPMIKSIDGIPKAEYFQSSNYKRAHKVTAKEYHKQIQQLWDTGKIKLKEN